MTVIIDMFLLLLSIPIFLMLLSHGPFKINNPGTRYCLLITLIVGIWTFIGTQIIKGDNNLLIWQWLAGYLIIGSTALIFFMFWSVLCWGYTLSMLLCIAKQEHIKDLNDWTIHYAGKSGIRQLTMDRFSILLNLKLVDVKENNIIATKRGYYLSHGLKIIRLFFGLGK